jgi:hypothetical protein
VTEEQEEKVGRRKRVGRRAGRARRVVERRVNLYVTDI